MVHTKKKNNSNVCLLLTLLTILYYIIFLHYLRSRSKVVNDVIDISSVNNNIDKKSIKPQSPSSSSSSLSTSVIFKNPRKVEKNTKVRKLLNEDFLYILLQPSPVDIKFRLTRLKAIDDGWSKWTDNLSELNQVVKVFASTVDQVNANTFRNIKAISLDSRGSPSASDYLVQAFSYLVLQVNIPLWLAFANDHTFMVPPNLVCFLRTLDSSLPIYTGNRLQRGDYKGTHLYFASGGAGAVLSHVALKSVFTAWILSGDIKMTTIIKSNIKRIPNKVCRLDNFKTNEDGLQILEIDAKSGSFYCASTVLFDWISSGDNFHSSHNISSIPILRIYLSEKRSLVLAKRHQNKVQIELFEKNYVLKGIDVKQIIKHCATDSEWAKINPGIVIANCLQVLFLTEFAHSEVDKTSERFNCYGLVRTISGDVDGWYIEAKNELPPGRLEMTGGFDPKPLSIAKDIVSLHYVSEIEGKLLYDILSGQLIPQNSDALKSVWPQTGQQVGAYSRKVKNDAEYEALYSYIMGKAKVYNFDTCRVKQQS